MKRFIRLMLVMIVMLGTGIALYQVAHNNRVAEKQRFPDPEQYRKQAWAQLRAKGLEPGMPVFIRIFKQSSELEVWLQDGSEWQHFRTIRICSYSGKLGPKLKEGDRQAPEGFYTVSRAQMNPNSRHHLAFNLGFPNRYDRALGRTGSFLMVHGGCSSIGCYAIRDHEVEIVYRLMEAAFQKGQQEVSVHAFPFRLETATLGRHRSSKWYGFWTMLKPGYERFEHRRQVPSVRVANRSYVVN